MTNNNLLETNDKANFVYQSISDIQGTIRAIDTKLYVIIVILSIPFSTIGKIVTKLSLIPKFFSPFIMECFAYVLFCFFGLLWLISFIISFKGIIGIDNPFCHISGDNHHLKGTFYNGGLFERYFIDSLLNRTRVQSSRNINEQINILPNTKEKLIIELASEQIKLSYIRDMKQLRHYWSFRLTFYWLLLGFCLYILLI